MNCESCGVRIEHGKSRLTLTPELKMPRYPVEMCDDCSSLPLSKRSTNRWRYLLGVIKTVFIGNSDKQ